MAWSGTPLNWLGPSTSGRNHWSLNFALAAFVPACRPWLRDRNARPLLRFLTWLAELGEGSALLVPSGIAANSQERLRDRAMLLRGGAVNTARRWGERPRKPRAPQSLKLLHGGDLGRLVAWKQRFGGVLADRGLCSGKEVFLLFFDVLLH